MKLKRSVWLTSACALLLAGCAARVPSGPSVMVLPGSAKNFDEFEYDDSHCRQWALRQSGVLPVNAANDTAINGAVVGTVLGAAAGAAIGAAGGDPGTGAAVGAGLGLLGGTAAGADQGQQAEWEVQHRYDTAYMQCMYAKGNQVPMPRGAQLPAPVRSGRVRVPPPPAGSPPPPPPGARNAR